MADSASGEALQRAAQHSGRFPHIAAMNDMTNLCITRVRP